MVASRQSTVLHRIRTLALHQNEGATDGSLLDLYVRRKDEAAFEALVRRHGRMVLGVCRRILGNSHDAEDAFQATFLVLVRKAASVRPAGMVGNWLYGVAHRTALEARRSAAKRRAKEAQVAPKTMTPDDALADLRPLLDQELARLPDRYRAVLVSCDLDGRTRTEAAHQLGLPEGTIASRLARARIILAKRLRRHGATLSGGALAAALAQDAASAPLALVFSTVKAATAYAAGPAMAAAVVSTQVAALTEGVMKSMLLSKLKMIIVLFVAISLGGTGWGSYRTFANDQSAVKDGEQRVAQADEKQLPTVPPARDKAKKDGKKASDEKKSTDQELGKLLWEYMKQSYRPPQGAENARPGDKEAFEKAQQVSLMAFQIAFEIARGMSTKTPGDKASADQDQAKQMLELMRKGLDAYQTSKGKADARTDKDALDPYVEAFLKAFQISSEIAKAKGKPEAKLRPEDQAILDSCGPAFLQAYERATALKKALEQQQAAAGTGRDKTIGALEMFLESGREFAQTVKRRAKNQAVQQAKGEIENALSSVGKSTHDRRTQLETLQEIERLVQEMKKKLQDTTDKK